MTNATPVTGSFSAEPTDLNTLHRTVERLQARESHLLSLLNLARDAVVAMDPEGRVTDWNPAAEKRLVPDCQT